MQQIFVNESPVNDRFEIFGDDMHHLVRVVRIKKGEILRVSTLEGNNYLCQVENITDDSLIIKINQEVPSTELSNKIYLFNYFTIYFFPFTM